MFFSPSFAPKVSDSNVPAGAYITAGKRSLNSEMSVYLVLSNSGATTLNQGLWLPRSVVELPEAYEAAKR